MSHLLQPMLDWFKLRARTATAPSCRQPIAHPLRDWWLLSLGAGALLFVFIVMAAVLYIWSASSFMSEEPSVQGAGLNVQKLKATLDHYRAAENEHTELLNAAPTATDPAK